MVRIVTANAVVSCQRGVSHCQMENHFHHRNVFQFVDAERVMRKEKYAARFSRLETVSFYRSAIARSG